MNIQKDLVTVVFTEDEASAIIKEIMKAKSRINLGSGIAFAKQYPNLKELEHILLRSQELDYYP
jgi:hypothetical protein